ncbi:unnamed protein product [Polarella glacialis]|uniref:Uncharacterized protein n=1 Tax=Polarella glacialis TaxID=89957 RepID=A0A813L0A3_POLGL|nr:unnamed protein product [Polarella glacialis]
MIPMLLTFHVISDRFEDTPDRSSRCKIGVVCLFTLLFDLFGLPSNSVTWQTDPKAILLRACLAKGSEAGTPAAQQLAGLFNAFCCLAKGCRWLRELAITAGRTVKFIICCTWFSMMPESIRYCHCDHSHQ